MADMRRKDAGVLIFLSPIVAGPQIMRPAEIVNNSVVPCTGGEFACAAQAALCRRKREARAEAFLRRMMRDALR